MIAICLIGLLHTQLHFFLHENCNLTWENGNSFVDSFTDVEFASYIKVVSNLFSQLMMPRGVTMAASADSDTEDNSTMQWSSADDVISSTAMELDCLHILNSTGHVSRIVRLFTAGSSKNIENIEVMCCLCHCIMSRMKQAVHSNRSVLIHCEYHQI